MLERQTSRAYSHGERETPAAQKRQRLCRDVATDAPASPLPAATPVTTEHRVSDVILPLTTTTILFAHLPDGRAHTDHHGQALACVVGPVGTGQGTEG